MSGKKNGVLFGVGTAFLVVTLMTGCAREIGMFVGIDMQGRAANMQAPDTAFQSGERFRFRAMPSQNCYIYVLHEGSDGSYSILFPRGEAAAEGYLYGAKQWGEIPPDGWFQFDDHPGIERLIILASMKEIGEVEALRNRPLEPNDVKAVLKRVEEEYNGHVVKRAKVRYPDYEYHIIASRDPYPVLNLRLDLVHK